MYCKKCHKKIIIFFKTLHEIRNRCICPEQRMALTPAKGTELIGTENGNHVSDRIYKSTRKKGEKF